MAIYKRRRKKGDCYIVRITINGKRVNKTFDRKVDAVRFSQEVPEDLRLIDGSKVTFEESINEWLENHARPRKAPSTVLNNESIIKNDLLPTFGNMRLSNIQPHHIDAFIHRLQKRGLSNSSVNSRLELIRTVFNYQKKRRVVNYNPMDAVGLLKVDPKPMKFWTLVEAKTFLEYTHKKYVGTTMEPVFSFYFIALNTGMRVGEICALKWSVIDFNNRLVTVCRSKCHHTYKVRETTKGRRNRHVPMSDALYNYLQSLWSRRNGSEWVLNIDGKTLDKANITTRHWVKDIRECGVNYIRMHDMRHTFASHFMMNKGELFKLQAILGHADIRTTMGYSHFSKEYISNSANVVQFDVEDNLIKAKFQKNKTA